MNWRAQFSLSWPTSKTSKEPCPSQRWAQMSQTFLKLLCWHRLQLITTIKHVILKLLVKSIKRYLCDVQGYFKRYNLSRCIKIIVNNTCVQELNLCEPASFSSWPFSKIYAWISGPPSVRPWGSQEPNIPDL